MSTDPTLRARVEKVLAGLRLLDGAGRLQALDSLAMVDVVVELETVLDVRIPASKLRPETFRSIDAVVEMLTTL